MKLNHRFWLLLIAFQAAYGLAVFALARHIYRDDISVLADAVPPELPTRMADVTSTEPGLSLLDTPQIDPSLLDDPTAISRLADQHFAQKDYARAAELYERLLSFDPTNVDVYNNLGLTLHYVGRSPEALARLNEGVSVEPTHQRIWLTIGFVNSQLGDTEEATVALTHAIELDPSNDVGRSAREMLDTLP